MLRESGVKTSVPVWFALAMALFVGCSSKTGLTENAGSTVAGQVTLDGNPVAEAKIVLIPRTLMNAKNEIIPLAYGLTDKSGNYQLRLADGTEQIPWGTWRVIISKSGGTQAADPDSSFSISPSFFGTDDSPDMLTPASEMNGARNRIGEAESIPMHYNVDTTLSLTLKYGQQATEHHFVLSTIDPLLKN